MANRRMIPTSFFRDPDILMLGKDAQLILVGLVLAADDYGRELAHAHLLGKEMGYTPEQMEAGLQELVANDFLLLYEVGRHRYYTLTRWWQWQTITPYRRVPSVHPLPPGMQVCACDPRVECPQGACVMHRPCENEECSVHAPREHNAYTMHTPRVQNAGQENLGEENLSQVNEGEATPANVVAFPTAHTDITTTKALSANEVEQATRQVATILKIPVDDALKRLVADYACDPLLNFYGEADAARAWIEDAERNPTRKQMSSAWFRGWLKREHEQALARQAQRAQPSPQQATGTTGLNGTPRTASSTQGATKPPSLMNLEQHYQSAMTGAKGEAPMSTQIEKQIPFNLEAERAVLGSLLIDPEAITQIADWLTSDDFYRDAHRTIYRTLLALYERRDPGDFVTLSDELERLGTLEQVGGQSALLSLISGVQTSANVEHYGRIVRQKAIFRRLIHASGADCRSCLPGRLRRVGVR